MLKPTKKTKLGKKRLLGKPNKESKEKNEEIIVVGSNINQSQQENNASFLLKLILKAYYLNIWKTKVKSLRYFSRKADKQRINFKKLINEISLVINQHKCEYLNEIIEKMDKLPLPKNIEHDKNFGTLKIVNKTNKENQENKELKMYKNHNYINNVDDNKEEYIEENNNQKEIIYEEGSKEMDFNNNDFIENEYNTFENLEDNNFNNNIDYNKKENNNKQNYNVNEIEEDEAFIENEFDYKQDITKEDYNNNNIKYNNEYGQEVNFFGEIYDEYFENKDYDEKEINYENDNNNDVYYENQYNYYYNAPNDVGSYTNKEGYYEQLNKVNYIKNQGNNIIVSDVYVKPRIEKNQNQFYYYSNNNNYQANYNINGGNLSNKRAFPYSSHNHVFYISKNLKYK